MPALVLGPMLRHIGATDATVWLEADSPCEAEILDRSARTFAVDGRHYAIVVLEGLEPGASYDYDVRLDGERVWPEPGSALPPSTIRTVAPGRPVKVAFGSCRVTAPHEPPYTRRRASDRRGRGVDALHALAHRLVRAPADERPDTLLMLGDQIYADEPPDTIVEVLRERETPPGARPEELADLGDYALCYCDAWDEEPVRWLLSTVPTAMIFDDHEIHDGWKVSQAWLDDMRREPWYERRIAGGLAAYWLYQHLGNLSPAELRESGLLEACRQAEDAAPLLRDFATTADREANHIRWSFCRDLGTTRLLVVDSRAARHLEPGERTILNDEEWDWLRERAASEDYEHLLLASSVPFVVTQALHDLEAWNEAMCDRPAGSLGARLGESLRRHANLSHWAAFQRSFHQLAELLDDLSAGRLRSRPASIGMLSGDVHHCYVAQIGWPPGPEERTPVWQTVCSGLRKQLDPGEELVMKLVSTRAAAAVTGALARSAGARRPAMGWRILDGPLYANQIATLKLGEDGAEVRVETTAHSPRSGIPTLDTAFVRRLPAPGA